MPRRNGSRNCRSEKMQKRGRVNKRGRHVGRQVVYVEVGRQLGDRSNRYPAGRRCRSFRSVGARCTGGYRSRIERRSECRRCGRQTCQVVTNTRAAPARLTAHSGLAYCFPVTSGRRRVLFIVCRRLEPADSPLRGDQDAAYRRSGRGEGRGQPSLLGEPRLHPDRPTQSPIWTSLKTTVHS